MNGGQYAFSLSYQPETHSRAKGRIGSTESSIRCCDWCSVHTCVFNPYNNPARQSFESHLKYGKMKAQVNLYKGSWNNSRLIPKEQGINFYSVLCASPLYS